MSAGKLRTDMVATKVLSQRITGQISGTIIEVSRNQRGSPRYLITPTTIEEVSKEICHIIFACQQLPNTSQENPETPFQV